jgi:beta-lactamase class D
MRFISTSKLVFSIGFLYLTFLLGCSVNKAHMDEQLKPFFEQEQVEGSFTMLDNATGQVTVYNLADDTSRFAPGASFDLMTALVGLETGVIPDEKYKIQMNDSTAISAVDAFKQRNKIAFSAVAQEIGSDKFQNWIDSMGYGNRKLGNLQDVTWPNLTMKISPDEQLGLMKRLYFDQLPFRKSVQETLRNWMLEENNSAYRLSARTASVNDVSGAQGWYVGWIEENRHVYFFVTLVKKKQATENLDVVAQKVNRTILEHYGFFKGKK